MKSAISDAAQFLFRNDLRTILARVRGRNVPALIQFSVYAMCGLMATVVHNGLVVWLSLTLLPAGKDMVVDGVLLAESVRKTNLLINNTISFPIGCIVAYFTNILFVFTPGKHSRIKELLLFFGVAACGFFPGLWVIDFLVGRYNVPSIFAQCAFVITSFLVNFFMRKFVIFKG